MSRIYRKHPIPSEHDDPPVPAPSAVVSGRRAGHDADAVESSLRKLLGSVFRKTWTRSRRERIREVLGALGRDERAQALRRWPQLRLA